MAKSLSINDLTKEHRVLTGYNRFIYLAIGALIFNVLHRLFAYTDTYGNYVCLTAVGVLLFTLLLDAKKYTLPAKIISALTFNIVFLLISMRIGIRAGVYLYYFPLIVAYIYLFRTEGNSRYVLTFSIITFGFMLFSVLAVPDYPPVFKMPDSKIKEIFYISFFTSFILTVYFFLLIYKYQEKLYSRLIELEKMSKRQQLRSVIEAQETSIQSIVYELRNNISQTLAASKFFLDEAKDGKSNPEALSKSLVLTDEAMNALTILCIKMHPAIITDIGLIEGVLQYIDELKKISPVQIKFEFIESTIEQLDEKDKISIFRIIQDYITIVLKNTGTSKVNVNLHYQPALVSLTLIQNDPSFNFMLTDDSTNLNSFNNRITYFHSIVRQHTDNQFETTVVELIIT